MLTQKLKSSCKIISVGLGLFSSYVSYQYQQTFGDKVDVTLAKNIDQIQKWFTVKSKMAFTITEFYLLQYCKKLSTSSLFHQMDVTLIIIFLANSQNVLLHDIGVKLLSVVQFPSDIDMGYYINQCKPNTLIGLARSNLVCPKWFQNGYFVLLNGNESEVRIKAKLEVLLEKIEASQPNVKPEELCTSWLYNRVKNEQLPQDPVLNVMVDLCTERDNLELTQDVQIPFQNHVRTYLDILRRYSTDPKVNSDEVISHEMINIVKEILSLYRGDVKLHAECGNILANLALSKCNIEPVSTFIPLFLRWKQGESFALRIIADRCLYNLDKPRNENLLDGIFILHPNTRQNCEPDVDVIFIHGINGSPFHTWREKNSTNQGLGTLCWPKDWLPNDLPNIRVLAVHYNTKLSEWSLTCPVEKQKYSLDNQSLEIKEKLVKCGVGERPIIWVAHSMGGLIVKKILISPNNNQIVDSTKGALFYSVPHLGSPVATQSEKARFILFPSVEANELSQTSTNLKELHQKFLSLVHNRKINCVDFGESKASPLPYIKVKSVIVPRLSSDVGYGKYILLDSNHRDTCKPESRTDIKYTETVEMIKKVSSGKVDTHKKW